MLSFDEKAEVSSRTFRRLLRRKTPELLELLRQMSVKRRELFVRELIPKNSHDEWREARAGLRLALDM